MQLFILKSLTYCLTNTCGHLHHYEKLQHPFPHALKALLRRIVSYSWL